MELLIYIRSHYNTYHDIKLDYSIQKHFKKYSGKLAVYRQAALFRCNSDCYRQFANT